MFSTNKSKPTRKLSELLQGLAHHESTVKGDPLITGVKYDSRKVESGNLFVAIKGEATDGNLFITQAVENGAEVLVSESGPEKENISKWVRVADDREALSAVADRFYGQPSKKMHITGITGTNGKTSCTYIIKSIFEADGTTPGVLGTIGYSTGREIITASRTTPEAPEINEYLSRMKHNGIKHCVMEVSSHSIALKRTAHINFDIAVFTNLTNDHLDYHITMEDYYQTKKALFADMDKDGLAVINIDDMYGERLVQELKSKVKIVTFGKNKNSDYRISDYELLPRKSRLTITHGNKNLQLVSPLLGESSIYNIATSVAVAREIGINENAVKEGVSSIQTVPGRMERINLGQPYNVFIDYAHTPDALMRLLQSVREITGKDIITVFGCGGDRDKVKRPLMGQHAVLLSDKVIITNDNPRTENPDDIIEDIVVGIKEVSKSIQFEIIKDRREAIKKAISLAQPDDAVVIAGKGHETYQIIGEKVTDFDDKAVAEIFIRGAQE